MKNILLAASFSLLAGAATLSASSVCPSTANTTTDCAFIITIGSTGSASVREVAGATAFNGPITFVDNTTDPGDDGSLVGVINDSSKTLTSFALTGSGANAGAFDFSFNGICVYTAAAYCSTAQTGYEGPTTTFSDLQSTVLFQTTEGTVTFNPGLATDASTYFAIEGAPSDFNSDSLRVSDVTFATPEPSEFALISLGLSLLAIGARKFHRK
jgi:hypothetical protein